MVPLTGPPKPPRRAVGGSPHYAEDFMAEQKTSEFLSEYETPELIEIGAAESLTLGSDGCGGDGTDCQHHTDAIF